MLEINGDLCHTLLSKNMPKVLRYNEKNDFSAIALSAAFRLPLK